MTDETFLLIIVSLFITALCAAIFGSWREKPNVILVGGVGAVALALVACIVYMVVGRPAVDVSRPAVDVAGCAKRSGIPVEVLDEAATVPNARTLRIVGSDYLWSYAGLLGADCEPGGNSA